MNTGRIITTALAATILAIPAMAADAPGYFKVPGTDTTIKIFGSVNTQATYEMTNYFGIGNGLSADATPDSTMKSNQWTWRANGDYGFTTTTPSPLGDVNVKLEWNYRDKSNYSGVNGLDEFKNAYVEIGGLLVGRASSNFPDGDAAPNALDTDGMQSDSWYNPGRMIQIRYNASINKQVSATFAIEQPQDVPTFKNADGTKNFSNVDHQFPGSLVAALSFADSWGHVRGAVAYEKYASKTNDGVLPSTSTSMSVSATSWVIGANFVLGKGNLVAEVRQGVGYYGTGKIDTFYLNNVGDGFEAAKATAYEIGYTFPVSDALSVAAGIGQVKFAKDTDVNAGTLAAPNAIHFDDYKLLQAFVNVQYQLTKTVSIGAEYFYGKVNASETKPWVEHDGTATDSIKESRLNFQIAANLF